ncbi:MAG: hypothetical protein MJ057_07595 [Sphaerochaetaceae bacterium]|nr:hypothetical protein [Sphaerochaetaceae bacterium]
MKTFKKLLRILLGLVMGASFGLCAIPNAIRMAGKDASFLVFESLLVLNCLFVVLVYDLVIMVHEAGHLIAGLLSGYSFVSYRVFSITLIKLNGKLKLKRFSLAGTAGQCLMKPPVWTEKGIPVRLYNLGGILLNVLCFVVSLPLCFVVPMASFGGMFVLSFAVLSAITALMNGIPMANNDGDNAVNLEKNLVAVRAFWSSMMGNALLAEGVALADFPQDLYAVPEDADPTNPHIASSIASNAQIPLFHHRFEDGDRAIAEALEKTGQSLHPVIRILLVNERIWFELMHENRKDILDGFMTKEFVKYQKAMRTMPSMIRVLYTQALADGNAKDAQKHEASFAKIAKTHPYQQEIDDERYLMGLAKQHFALSNT